MWKAGPFSAYGWASIIAGLFCILLALIFASLTSVMPRSGGDYVFTSRILHPALGWLESWTLVIASVLIIAFEVPLVLRNLQITARIIGIGAGGLQRRQRVVHRRHRRDHRHAGVHRLDRRAAGHRGHLRPADADLPPGRDRAGRVRRRLLRRDVHLRAAVHPQGRFVHNLPHYTGGVTAAKIAASGHAAGVLGAPPQSFLSRIFDTGAFPIVLSVLLFQFIGFQYSAYIAGEVRGNVRRGVLIALLGALLIGVLANSVYVDAISSHFGFDTNVSWGAGYWGWPQLDLAAAAGPAQRDAAAGGGGQPQPVAALGADQPRRGGVPVPAVPGVHQLHQPHAAGLEPGPPGAGVVRAASTSACAPR